VLSYIAAATSRIRLLTTVTVLSLLDPVRVAEDYATLDQLSGGRLDIIIGKGNDPDQNALFGYDLDGQWDRNREKYELLRRLLRETGVTWSGTYRPRRWWTRRHSLALTGRPAFPCGTDRPHRRSPPRWRRAGATRCSRRTASIRWRSRPG
jgi:alkanesulfonate monooxygenase SsuD/methylene tetrahydromethanopterin reductase-like flavin-dependent oxidoreductase (luciferase family)